MRNVFERSLAGTLKSRIIPEPTQVSPEPLADLDVISLGPNLVNLLLFLLIPADNSGSGLGESCKRPVRKFAHDAVPSFHQMKISENLGRLSV